MTRPIKFTEEIMAEICERMVKGESLSAICDDDSMPDRITVWRWCEATPSLRNQYARARECLMDFYADQIVKLAYDDSRDTMKVGENTVANHAAVQRDRLKVDTLKWIMSKLAPKQYGDKVETLPGNHGPLTFRWENAPIDVQPIPPPPQITFNPGPLPNGVDPDMLARLLRTIKECVPIDDARPASDVIPEIFAVIEDALRAHYAKPVAA